MPTYTFDEFGNEIPYVPPRETQPPAPPPTGATPTETQPTPASTQPPAAPAPTQATLAQTQPTPAQTPAAGTPGLNPPPPLAGLTSDGSVYLARDGLWQHIPDVATFNALGLDWNAIAWYGQLPGSVGEPLPTSADATEATGATQATTQPTPARPPSDSAGPLAGLLSDKSVFIAAGGTWHHIPNIDTFNAMALDWN